METTFAKRLAELRKVAGLTQEGLADKSGVSIGNVRDLEQGRRQPSWATVQRLAKALGVTPNDFLLAANAKRRTK